MMSKIRLGSHVKEIINGKTGFACERIIWMFGCDYIGVILDLEYEAKDLVFGISRAVSYSEDRLVELDDSREELIISEDKGNQDRFFGKEVKDKVTGIKGVVIGRKVPLFGSDQYAIQPKANKKGIPDAEWLDEGRLEIIGNGVKQEEVMGPKPGGCAYISDVFA